MPTLDANMEGNATEFCVQGITGTFSSYADLPESSLQVVHRRCAYSGSPTPFPCGKAAGGTSGKIFMQYKNATQHLVASGLKVSTISKAGVGIIKTVTTQWRNHERKAMVVRSSSAGSQCAPSDSITCPGSAAQLGILGQTRPSSLELEPHQDKLRRVKPQNCRRMVALGARGVGKTSILRRFLRDSFEELYEPTWEDFHTKLYQIRGQTYQMDILDASGERDFPAKRRLSILTGDIFLLVFSLNDRDSFDEVCVLLKEIVAAKTKLIKSKQNACIPIIICGNKVDLDPEDRVVSPADVYHRLGEDCTYFEISARDGTNLKEMFEDLAERGGLPAETGPTHHRKISIRSYQALRTGRRGGRAKVALSHDTPCGALYPLARRPSFGSDLRQVLGPSTSRKRRKPLEKCHIQ